LKQIKYTAEYKSNILLIQIFINARLVLLLEGIWVLQDQVCEPWNESFFS